MFARNVKVNYGEVDFWVNVCCLPETPIEELEKRAIVIIENVFRKNGIMIAV